MTAFPRIAASILLAVYAARVFAQGQVPAVPVCQLVTNPSRYDQQHIQLHANVVAEPHGYHLMGKDCPNGSVGLVIPGQSSDDAKFTDMMRRVMAHHGRGQIVITGVFHAAQDHRQVGTLTLDDVLSVTGADR